MNDTNINNPFGDSSDVFLEDDITNILNDNGFPNDNNESESTWTGQTMDNIVQELNNEDNSQETLNNSVNTNTEDEEDLTIDDENEESEESQEETNYIDETKIPLNSPTLLIDESTSRFSGTEWYNEIQKARVIIAGVGGIGRI